MSSKRLPCSSPGALVLGELVDQAELGRALEYGRQVHLVDVRSAVLDLAAGQSLEPLGLRLGLGPRVRLEVADQDITAGGTLGSSFLEHPVGLADAGRHAQEDLVMAAH